MLLRNSFLIATVIAVSLSAAPAFSIPIFSETDEVLEMSQMYGNSKGERMKKDGFMEKLNLTEAQKNQIEQIQAKRKTQMTQIHEQLRVKQNELRTMMTNNASNEQLRTKHGEITQLRQQLGNLNFENMLEIRAVLTPEQRNQMGQMMLGYREGDRPRSNR